MSTCQAGNKSKLIKGLEGFLLSKQESDKLCLIFLDVMFTALPFLDIQRINPEKVCVNSEAGTSTLMS